MPSRVEEIPDSPEIIHILTDNTDETPTLDLNEEENEEKNGKKEEENEEIRFTPEQEDELIAQADDHKIIGNGHFRQQDYAAAIVEYQLALDTCPIYLKERRSIYHANLGICHLKLSAWENAVASCTEAIVADPKYVKAYQRRATANEHINTWASLQSAMDDYKRLVDEILPQDSIERRDTLSKLKQLEPRLKETAERETQEMLGKLKDVGNSILGKFGLSTDMFKMDTNSSGKGYSFNMNK